MPREGAGVGAEEARRDERPLTGPVSGRLPAEHSLTDRKVRGAWRRLPGARDRAGTGGRGARPQQEALRTPQSLSFSRDPPSAPCGPFLESFLNF